MIRYHIIIAILLFCISSIYSQQSKFSLHFNAGVHATILDSGFGFNIGAQQHFAISRYLGMESLINYSTTEISGAFISGNSGNQRNFNILVGGRLYLNAPEKNNRWFLNILFGKSYLTETNQGSQKISSWESGGSYGLYFQPKKFLVGVGLESPGYLFLRVGYTI